LTALPLSLPHKHATRSPWPAMLGQNLVRFLLGQQTALVEGLARVEILACRKPGQIILHFLNHNYGAGDAIPGRGEREFYRDLPVQLSDALWQTTRRIRTTPEGRELEKAQQSQFRGFILPSLGVYQAVVLEQGT